MMQQVEKEEGRVILVFFETREKAVRDVKRKGASEKKERNTMSKIISGHCITKNDILEQMTQHEHQQKSKETVKRKTVSPDNNEGASGSGSKKQKKQTERTDEEIVNQDTQEEEILEKDLCCVGGKFTLKK